MEAMSLRTATYTAEERVDQLANTNELAADSQCYTTRTIGNLVQKRRIPVLKVGSLNRFNVQRVLGVS